MGIVESNQNKQQVWTFLFLAGLIAGLILRFYLADFAKMPGHGDSAFYYTVAKNIAEGRGPVIDYIVYFFNGLLPLPHYAGDFWNPTASFLIAVPMLAFGRTISSALIAPIVAGILPAVAAYLAGRKYSGSIALGALAGVLTFFSPYQVWVSVLTEAIIFSGAFAAISILCMMKSDDSPRYLLLAAVFSGLANLIRQDNILLLLTLEVWILFAALAWRKKLLLAAAALGIHLLILSPLIVKNYSEFHAAFPQGPAKTAFLTTYEDFHSYNKELDWQTLRATWGIRGIFEKKLHTAEENIIQAIYFIDPVLTVLFLIAAADLAFFHRKKRHLRLLVPALIFASLEYLFYTLIASFSGPGSLAKGLAALLPYMCIIIVDFLGGYLRRQALLVAAVLVLAAYSGYQGFEKNYTSTIYYNGIYQEYGVVRSLVIADADARQSDRSSITILARDVWDVYEGTGFKTVMIPNNDLETIYFVAKYYGAEYILLPAPRKPLDPIYNETKPDSRFVLVADIPNSDLRVFRIVLTP